MTSLEADAVQDLWIDSRALGRAMNSKVVLPPGYDAARAAAYPVLYFLHPWGLSPRYIVVSYTSSRTCTPASRPARCRRW